MDALASLDTECGPFLHGALEHAFGEVQAGDALARLGESHGDAAGAAAQLEDGIAEVAGGFAVKGDVLGAVADDGGFVVVIGDEGVVEGGGGFCVGGGFFGQGRLARTDYL